VPGIGVLREGPLHATLKEMLAEPGDRVEVPVGRFLIDLVRADGELLEVQTGGFSALSPKLDALLDEYRVRIVHPIAAERRIVRVDADGQVVSARLSPKRGTALEVFDRLVAFPSVLDHPNLTIELMLVREDHLRGTAPVARRRRTRDPGERRLVEVLERVVLRGGDDLVALLPSLPAEPFSTRELAGRVGCRLVLAQRIVYCLRVIGALTTVGRRGRAPLYEMRGGLAGGAAPRQDFSRAVP
jgi:hypothetical protein